LVISVRRIAGVVMRVELASRVGEKKHYTQRSAECSRRCAEGGGTKR
jgi:hypothetical protein